MTCTHPDHNDSEDCRERAISCSETCDCCFDEVTIKFYAEKREKYVSKEKENNV